MSITVLDSTGATQTVETLPAKGQATKANSLPVALASDDDLVAATGAKADAAWGGSGAGSVIAILKGIFAAPTPAGTNAIGSITNTAFGVAGALPAGTNKVGGITVADGDDATQGAIGNAAYAGSGSGTVVAILKGLYALLAGTLVTRRAQASVSQTR